MVLLEVDLAMMIMIPVDTRVHPLIRVFKYDALHGLCGLIIILFANTKNKYKKYG